MQSKKIQLLKKKLNYRNHELDMYYDHLAGKDIKDFQIQAVTVKLEPNKTMFNYMYNVAYWRNYWWNDALTRFEDQQLNYQIARMGADEHTVEDSELAKLNKYPSFLQIRNEMVREKTIAEQLVSSRALQLVIKDLTIAEKSHEEHPEKFHKPKHKEFDRIQPNFKSDRVRIKDGRLILDRPRLIDKENWSTIKMHGFRIDLAFIDSSHPVLTSFYLKNGQWFANLAFRVVKHVYKHSTNEPVKSTGVDLNVHAFVDSKHVDDLKHAFSPMPSYLDKSYSHLSWADHRIALCKRINKKLSIKRSKRLAKLLKTRQDIYRQIKFIQTDLCQKYTWYLVTHYTDIAIEDLNVEGMKMSHRCKNTQRAMFGIFRRTLTYKAQWYGVTLNFAHQQFPSTQRCSTCGMVKTGNDKITLDGNNKHHTKHSQYICYNPQCPNYNVDQGRDPNAEYNLDQLNYYDLIAHLTIFALTNQPSLCNNNYKVLLHNM